MSNTDILYVFSHNVREVRNGLGISQEKLAELASLHRTYIGMVERMEKNITLRNADKIAKALDTPLFKLLK